MEDYSKLLTALRERTGWTQERLASELGISRVMVSQIESGTRKPSVKVRHAINHVLGIYAPTDAPTAESSQKSSAMDADRLLGIIESQQRIIESQQKTIEVQAEAIKTKIEDSNKKSVGGRKPLADYSVHR